MLLITRAKVNCLASARLSGRCRDDLLGLLQVAGRNRPKRERCLGDSLSRHDLYSVEAVGRGLEISL
jgi:predicted MarR family transcription regulator